MPSLPFSPSRIAGDVLFVSGQVGARDGALVDGGVEAQTSQALTNLAAVLERSGLTTADVVKTTVFLAGMDHYAGMNAMYAEVFTHDAPARSAFAVAGLPLGALVEIEAVALVPSRH